MKRIAALLTCHNRKAKTIACLDALFASTLPEKYSLDVFLVDDGSSDGTEQAVRVRYLQVNVIKGDGNLYWNGGMRVAFAAAMEQGFDYYLWLNDDTLLYPSAIQSLIATSGDLQTKQGKNVIVVGSTQDASDGRLTYGGVIRPNKWKALFFKLVTPKDVPIECETMNGNCVLIPSEVAQAVGNMEPKFAHAMGDLDYGFRARWAGCDIWLAPGFVGECQINDGKGLWSDRSLSWRERFRKLLGPKGLPPKEWLIFTRRHSGPFWFVYWIYPYMKFCFQGLMSIFHGRAK